MERRDCLRIEEDSGFGYSGNPFCEGLQPSSLSSVAGLSLIHISLNYLDHDGLVENTNFQRINTRISSNYHYLDNRLRIGENVAINRWTQTLSPAGVDENAIKQHPAKTVYDENGNYNDAINDVLCDACLLYTSFLFPLYCFNIHILE